MTIGIFFGEQDKVAGQALYGVEAGFGLGLGTGAVYVFRRCELLVWILKKACADEGENAGDVKKNV